MALEYLQMYWWLVIGLLAAILVFMLFVQGGQTMLFETAGSNDIATDMEVNALGRKWELTFTVLVVFGGAFFASFPMFYSTSFGGAYWLWMAILFSFVVQAVSYEFRRKRGNLYGTRVYDGLLFANGCIGCVLLGVAVAMMFFGAEFTVSTGNLLDGSSPVISQWSAGHGLEAMVNWKNLVLGFAVLFLARTMASLYFLNSISGDSRFMALNRARVLVNGVVFVLFFLGFLALLLTATGLEVVPERGSLEGSHSFVAVPNKYLHNLIDMWWVAAILLLGVVAVVAGIAVGGFSKRNCRRAIWLAGPGVVMVIMALWMVAGFNDTAYYPSTVDAASSLTIYNSSSSRFTLTVMSWVTLIIPFVAAYIIYVWRAMNRTDITPEEMRHSSDKY